MPRSAVPLTDVVSVTSVERFMMTSCYYPTFIIGVGVAFEVFPLTPMVLTEVLLLGLLSAGVRRARGCVMYPEGDTEQNYLARAHDLTTICVSFFNACATHEQYTYVTILSNKSLAHNNYSSKVLLLVNQIIHKQ